MTLMLEQDDLQGTQNWLYSSVQTFFTTCNWDDQPIAPTPQMVQQLEQAAAIEPLTELSFNLPVGQFFAAIHWEGTAVRLPLVEPLELLSEPTDDFTLTDFSDLF